MGRDHVKVPHDLRGRGPCCSAHSFNVAPLHLRHRVWGHHHLGNHCEMPPQRKRALGLLRGLVDGVDGADDGVPQSGGVRAMKACDTPLLSAHVRS